MACELCVSGLRYLTTEYPRIPLPTGLSAAAKAIPPLGITPVIRPWLPPVRRLLDEDRSTERRKPSVVGYRPIFGCSQARHDREYDKVSGMNRRRVSGEIKSALTLKLERLWIWLICVGGIYYPGFIDISGSLNLSPAIVIESPLNGSRGHAQRMDLCNCCSTCAIQRKPVVRGCSGV